ncbi:alpha/beta fold hydrolase [Pseudonocardia acaciae]|uniref:alpha/beta fold hydrolase n=1 Tax=Pseudonocardia acaciae TaxID=551276 RepID=UPI00048EDF51|nr:alpha/beta hydrolase [Pseudonocardia acaciae]
MDHDAETVLADDGCELWATAAGTGRPLILCHGGPGLWDMFGEVAAALAGRRRVIRWDQRGCGRSQRRGPYELARTLRDLDAVRRHFGLERAAVLGHSWGATVALRYALEHPDRVSALGYVAGTGLGRDWHPEYKRNLAERLGDRLEVLDASTDAEDREKAVLQWTADFADQARATEYAERMADPWFEINHECNAALGAEARLASRDEDELLAACRGLAVPTLIVEGALDIRPNWAVDSLHRALPSVTRVTLPDVGHVPWLEAPEAFYAALLSHL